MPITQNRMIAVLNAALDYEQALLTACSLAAQMHEAAATGEKTWQEALDGLRAMLSLRGLLTRPLTSTTTLAVERSHFRRHKMENEAARVRAAEKRALNAIGPVREKKQRQGEHQDYIELVKQRTTAPRTMQREGRLADSALEQVVDVKDWTEEQLDPKEWVERATLRELEAARPPEQKQRLVKSTLDAETMARIEREAEQMVASHPGTVGESEVAVPGVDFEDEADEGTELDPKVKDSGEEKEVKDL